MKLSKIYLIILYQIIEIFVIVQSDHVEMMRCSKEPQCLENLDDQLLEIIKENLENKTQPCEHFWNYACGSWTSAPYYDHLDNFGAMANYYADTVIKILQELHTSDVNIKQLVGQLIKYFVSCKSMENYDFNMQLYLKELPVQIIFGENFKWHQVFQQNENIWQNFNWLKAVAYFRKYGFKEIFLQESVGFAWNNSQLNVLQIKTPHAKTNFKNKYQVLKIMAELDLIFGYNNTKNYLKLAHQIFEFDKSIMDLSKNNEIKKQDLYIPLQDLSHLVKSIDWSLYFEVLLNQIPPPHTTIQFAGNLKYFQDLEVLLQQTPKNIQGCYILIKFCQYLMGLHPLITDRECLLHTNVMFPLAVNYIYNRFLYKTRNEDEQILQRIFSLLKHKFSQNLEANKFALSMQELQFLEYKLSRMRLKIGNLPLRLPDINHYYSIVKLEEYNFFHNHLEMLKFRTWQQHQHLLNATPANFDTDYINDDISQLRTAPYFIHQRNTVIVPMIFLQLPFYHYAQHPVLQFSLVGWIMAHELSHAFDTHGLSFDAWGNENVLGIQLSRKAPYLSAVECLIKHTRAVSLNERMADVNGLQLAWQTFSQQIPKTGEYYKDFALGKLFFINFAQFFCGSLPRAIGHDRDDIRVRQSVTNMREFAEVFRCSRIAKENPAGKCNIWRS